MITANVGTATVEILDVFNGSGRKVALVKFPTERYEWTHGGWAPTRTGTVDVNLLRDITVEGDCECTPDLPDGRTGNRCRVCRLNDRIRHGNQIPF